MLQVYMYVFLWGDLRLVLIMSHLEINFSKCFSESQIVSNVGYMCRK